MASLITGYLMEAAARRRDELLRRLESARMSVYLKAAERLWRPLEEGADAPDTMAGVDGSSYPLDFKGFTLYAVTSTAHAYERSGAGYRVRRTCRMVDVDILEPPLIAERIRLYREALEAKAAFHMLDGSEVLLMDGSIISTLIKPAPFEQASLPEAVDLARLLWGDGVFDELLDLFRESLPHSSGALAAKAMVGERPPRSKGYINAVVLLEYLEKLLSYKAVLEKAASAPRRPLIGFVSKTSRSHLYFEEQARKQGRHPPPDIYVFEALDPPPGYAEPREAPMPKLLPEELGIAGFFRSVRVVVSYVRLVRGGPVMRVEIPLGSRSDVGRLASMLAPVSPDGYPHPLHEAHMSCRVSRRDMVNVARMLGIDVELTGREVLGEWL